MNGRAITSDKAEQVTSDLNFTCKVLCIKKSIKCHWILKKSYVNSSSLIWGKAISLKSQKNQELSYAEEWQP